MTETMNKALAPAEFTEITKPKEIITAEQARNFKVNLAVEGELIDISDKIEKASLEDKKLLIVNLDKIIDKYKKFEYKNNIVEYSIDDIKAVFENIKSKLKDLGFKVGELEYTAGTELFKIKW